MRILHTSDLHIGRMIGNERRDEAFRALLTWLIDTVLTQSIDTVLIAGDVFDSTTPTHSAQGIYYRFLAQLAATQTCRHVIITGGNHDSPSLINAPQEILSTLNVTVVGAALENPADEVLVLKDSTGKPEALVAAVPYLRERDLRTVEESESLTQKEQKVVAGVKRHYDAVTDVALKLRQTLNAPDIPFIAMGHIFAAGASAEESVRDLYVGTLGQIPASIFSPDIDYLALGHIHHPYTLQGNPLRRYSGTPMALDFSDTNAEHSVCIIETQGRKCSVSTLAVPSFDRLINIEGNVETILKSLQLVVDDALPALVQVVHTTNELAVGLVESINALTENTPVRVIRVIDAAQSRALIASQDMARENARDLEHYSVHDMFRLRLEKEKTLVFSDDEKHALTELYDTIVFEIENADPLSGEATESQKVEPDTKAPDTISDFSLTSNF